MKQAVIRVENKGILIWNPLVKRYFYYEQDTHALSLENKSIRNKLVMLGETEIVDASGIEYRVIDNRGKTDRVLYTPLECYFDYTNICNLNCKGCYNKTHLNNSTMDTFTIQKIIEELSDLGIMRLHLAGGEPTLFFDKIETYLRTAHKKGIITSMATNGTLLTVEMCEMLLAYDLIALSVSLDGYNEESNSVFRANNSFKAALSGLQNVISTKKRVNAKTEICLKPTYSPIVDECYFEKMILWAIDLGVDKIKFANPERSMHHSLKYYSENIEQYYKNIETIELLKEKYKNQICITNITNPAVMCNSIGIPNMKGCIGGQELIAINPDGRITPCLMNDYYLENYYHLDTLEDFFFSNKKLVEYLTTIDNTECHSCGIYYLCRGGCQVRKYIENGKIMGKDPLCPKTVINSIKKDIKKENVVNVYHSL